MKNQKNLLFARILLCSMTIIAPGCGVFPGESEVNNGPEMRPGENCNSCHSFTFSGTLFPSEQSGKNEGIAGGTILLTDANGSKVTLKTNGAGNFYTYAALTFPVQAKVSYNGKSREMSANIQNGACSSCHTVPPRESAPGRLFIE